MLEKTSKAAKASHRARASLVTSWYQVKPRAGEFVRFRRYNKGNIYKDHEIERQLFSRAPLVRDLELVDFIDERMPLGRKRKGIPKSLLYEAKDKFGLSSKSSILRAYNRAKSWKSDVARAGFEIEKRNPGR
jgi:hypothetical protein